jgi:hypothetical protein
MWSKDKGEPDHQSADRRGCPPWRLDHRLDSQHLGSKEPIHYRTQQNGHQLSQLWQNENQPGIISNG